MMKIKENMEGITAGGLQKAKLVIWTDPLTLLLTNSNNGWIVTFQGVQCILLFLKLF